MRPLAELGPAEASRVVGVLCDIDDTLTWEGRLVPAAFDALARAQRAGLKVVPVTGRPAGWVDHLARAWPVDGVVGENGGLWFFHDGHKLQRRFAQPLGERERHREALKAVGERILEQVPGTALASDQPYRELDVAIDFCEDVPRLDDAAVDRIVALFHEAGATCKVSSIHVNGWFGAFDKVTGVTRFLHERWGTTLDEAASTWVFVGDSANDEPMFERFELSVGVANVAAFLPRLRTPPAYVTPSVGGHGFAELIDHLLAQRSG